MFHCFRRIHLTMVKTAEFLKYNQTKFLANSSKLFRRTHKSYGNISAAMCTKLADSGVTDILGHARADGSDQNTAIKELIGIISAAMFTHVDSDVIEYAGVLFEAVDLDTLESSKEAPII